VHHVRRRRPLTEPAHRQRRHRQVARGRPSV